MKRMIFLTILSCLLIINNSYSKTISFKSKILSTNIPIKSVGIKFASNCKFQNNVVTIIDTSIKVAENIDFLSKKNFTDKTKHNSFSLGFGSIISKIESFSPTLEICYGRKLWKGLELHLGYMYSYYNHKNYNRTIFGGYEYYVYTPRISSQFLFVGLNYNFGVLRNFTITPFFQGGASFHSIKYDFPEDLSCDVFSKGWSYTFSTGVRMSYDFSFSSIFISYGYYLPILSMEMTHGPFLTLEAPSRKSFNLYHHEIKIGVEYKF